MPLSNLLQLMGLGNQHDANNNRNSFNNCNYGSTIVPDWELVNQRLLSHPEEAHLNATYDDTINSNVHFSSPLYIALRNECTPIPARTLRILLRANPGALTDETLNMACRNPCTSTEVMNVLLDARPDYSAMDTPTGLTDMRDTTIADNNDRHGYRAREVGIRRGGYRSWHPPLHIAAKRGRSVEAVGALLERNGRHALWARDCSCRIPLHEACAEGSPHILRFILEEGFRSDVTNEGRELTAVGGGLFERDLLGLTPLECAMLKSKHLEDCYAKDIKNCSKNGESGIAYYHSNDFQEKRVDAWKRLVLCVQAAAAAIRHNSCSNVHNISFIDNMFDIPFLQAAVEFVAWGKIDLRFDDLFHLLLHTGHCNSKNVASTIDESGRLPFQLAEEQGLTFNSGLVQILAAHPEALFVKDMHVRIVPRMIAALYRNFGQGMIYAMVTNAPHFFDYRKNQQVNFEDSNKSLYSSQCNGGSIDDDSRLYGDHEERKL